MLASWAPGTTYNYKGQLQKWLEFCGKTGRDPLSKSPQIFEEFIGYLFVYTQVSGDGAARTFTAMRKFFIEHKVEFYKPTYIGQLLKGFRILRPVKVKFKRPFCHILVTYFQKYCWHHNHVGQTTLFVALVFAYWGALRPGEYTHTKFGVMLRVSQLRWNPSEKKPIEVILTLTQSKTNRNQRLETITFPCKCGSKRFGYDCICPVHLLRRYLHLRREHIAPYYPNSPLFVNTKNKPLPYDTFRNYIKQGIKKVSSKVKVDIDSSFYSPHCLRIGGCTDLTRDGVASWKISRLGRWTSDCWKNIYVNLDFYDIARLRGETVSEIRDKLILN